MKKSKNYYNLETYRPNKNCKPVEVNGTKYLSKAQACALEEMTMKELNEYLKNNK